MKTTDVAIIGASAAGLMAAVTLRKRNSDKDVTVIRNVDRTLVPCGIPYIYGTLGNVDKNIIPDQNFIDMGINVLYRKVDTIERKEKKLVFADGGVLAYDKLIIGTGSGPFLPPIPGIDLENVFTIKKDPAHLQKMQDALQAVKNVVIIGGGFIGVEMAEQIALMAAASDKKEGSALSKQVSIVELLPHCLMMACEEAFCIEAEKELAGLSVNVMTGRRVASITGEGKVAGVQLEDGEVLPADLVLVAIGVAPDVELAQKCGLKADPRGGIAVNAHMQTEDADIFAAGDCAAKFSLITGKPSGIRLASVACSEGMSAADNLYHPRRKTLGALGAFATVIGRRGIAAAGLTTKSAAEEGIEVVIGEAIAPNRHPGHLPGCIPDMKARLLFRKDNGKIVGGHVLGGEAAADMVNALAVAIQSGATAEELATMQYATHPLLTASPLFYHIMLAAENAAIQFT